MEIDHIGYVVADIKNSVEYFVQTYNMELCDKIIFDKKQKVWLAMLKSSNNYQIELIEPAYKDSPSFDFLKKGGGLHHICYKVKNIKSAVTKLKTQGHMPFTKISPAPLLNNSNIIFLYSKFNKQIIELVEQERI